MTSESRAELYKQLLSLQGRINALSRTGVNQSPQPEARAAVKFGRRVLIPNQLVRFLTVALAQEFAAKFDVQGATIETTDPLGFDGGVGKVYSNSYANPLNFLRRDQLPPMQIDMTNIYDPYYVLDGSGWVEQTMMPVISRLGSKTFPQMASTSGPETGPSIFLPVSSDLLEWKSPQGSYVPRVYTYNEFVAKLSKTFNEIKSGARPKDTGVIYTFTHSGLRQGLSTWNLVGAETEWIDDIPQKQDCSRPTLGCFWFNDRTYQQILPRDIETKESFLAKINKYFLL